MPSIDRQNNRIYAIDTGPGKAVGININQKTGKMWDFSLEYNRTTENNDVCFIGPANHRVLVGTNIASNVPQFIRLTF